VKDSGDERNASAASAALETLSDTANGLSEEAIRPIARSHGGDSIRQRRQVALEQEPKTLAADGQLARRAA